MHNHLCNRRVYALKSGAEKIAPGYPRHGDQLTALAVIPFDRDGQVHSVVHQEGYFEREVTAQLLGQAEAGLNRIRIIVVFSSSCYASIGLAGGGGDAEGENLIFGERLERQFSETDGLSPQDLRRLCAVLQRPRLRIYELPVVT